MYLFRAVDAHGQTVDFYLSETRDREAEKIFLQKALANPDNWRPHVFATDGLRSAPAALRELKAEGKVKGRCCQRTHRFANNRIESDHRREHRPEIGIFPVPSRVDSSSEKRLSDGMKKYARQKFSGFLGKSIEEERYWFEMEFQYQPRYAYAEILAPFEEQTSISSSLLPAVELLTSHPGRRCKIDVGSTYAAAMAGLLADSATSFDAATYVRGALRTPGDLAQKVRIFELLIREPLQRSLDYGRHYAPEVFAAKYSGKKALQTIFGGVEGGVNAARAS
jgi:hypothetical protein